MRKLALLLTMLPLAVLADMPVPAEEFLPEEPDMPDTIRPELRAVLPDGVLLVLSSRSIASWLE